MLKFNPNLARYKNAQGAMKKSSVLKLSVEADGVSCNLLLKRDGEAFKIYPMTKSKGGFDVSVELESEGLFFYCFELDGVLWGADLYLNAKPALDGGEEYQLSVYDDGYKTPDFLKGAVIYQIFPDRFCRVNPKKVAPGKVFREDWGGKPTFRNESGKVLNNEFFGGNFQGIMSKLQYLKDLGVTVVYLNPISLAYSSHRYDTADYLTPDTVLGDEAELKDLLRTAKEYGISFVFDGVFNHTGADSIYFDKYGNFGKKGAYMSINSEFYDWYSFKNYPNEYDSWWDFENLPAIKKDSLPFQDFICEKVLPYYFNLGFKGVRLDVVDELNKDFVERIRTVSQKYGAAVIGEVWEDATNKIAYGERREYFWGKQLDSVMNYPLRDAIVNFLLTADTSLLFSTISLQINNFPVEALNSLMNVLSTHDTSRIITVLGRCKVITDKDEMGRVELSSGEYEKGKMLAKSAYTLTFTLYGNPSVYYGDEAGLDGDLDPYNRKCYPWGSVDEELLSHIEKLSKIRKRKVFESGNLNIIYRDDKVLCFERTDGVESVIVATSMAERDLTLTFSTPMTELLRGSEQKTRHTLRRHETLIFAK